jgi:hypothetical protein
MVDIPEGADDKLSIMCLEIDLYQPTPVAIFDGGASREASTGEDVDQWPGGSERQRIMRIHPKATL